MDLWYGLLTRFGRVSMRLFGGVTVEGTENVPPYGPLIVVANHQSIADPPFLAVAFRRPLQFMGKRALFRNPLLAYFLRALHAHPVNRDGRDVEAVRWALGALRQDQAIVVFPEGTRSLRGLSRGTAGAVYLALRSQAIVVPVGITGTERLQGVLGWLRIPFPLTRLRAVIGRPFTFPVLEGPVPPREVLAGLTAELMERIADLLPLRYRGSLAWEGNSDESVAQQPGRSGGIIARCGKPWRAQ